VARGTVAELWGGLGDCDGCINFSAYLTRYVFLPSSDLVTGSEQR
jgi:hypothetical protein